MPFDTPLAEKFEIVVGFCGLTVSLKFKIVLKNKTNMGEDTLKLFFKITKNADLSVKCFDIKDEFFGEYNLGNIF